MNPIFIVGVGRSGTTLLQTMLAGSRQVAFPPETAFLRRYVFTNRLSVVAAQEGVEGVLRLLSSDSRVARLGLDLREALSGLPLQDMRTAGRRIYERLMMGYARSRGLQRFGDKDPRLVERIPELATLWPSAHVVHAIRDPRAVHASKKVAAWSSKRPGVLNLLASLIQFQVGTTLGPRAFPGAYHEVRYEDLVERPEQELRRLCAALRIDYSPEMIRFQERAEEMISPDEPWKRRNTKELEKTRIAAWAETLAPAETALVEASAAEIFTRHGYLLAVLPRTGARRIFFETAGLALRGMAMAYALWAMR